jgi:uroporphyrin-3 C-methyltransferase
MADDDDRPEKAGQREPAGPLSEPEGVAEAAVEPGSPEAAPAPKPRGRAIGVLGLLAGLAGLGLAGYLYYLLIWTDPQSAVAARLTGMESELRQLPGELADLERRQQEALAAFREEQRREREDSAERLLEAVNELATQAPPSRREWKVAEVAYLLRIANHRLLMERDVDGTLALLRGADAILAELDDFSLFQVRARLADEILSLENVESSDVQGLFLRLEAVKTELGRQQLKLPKFMPEQTKVEAPGFWSALLEQLGGYLRFRRFGGASVKPLLAPEEAEYLELNLRLMLERAQLAALRREQVVFEQSLQTAADWIATYLDPEDPGIVRVLEELTSMSAVELDTPLPDISGSLGVLQSLGEA